MGSVISQLLTWLYNAFAWCLAWIKNILIDVINLLIQAVAMVFGTVISWLPNSTVSLSVPQSLIDLGANINWLVPVSAIVNCLTLIAVAYVAYFAVRPILKFLQLT